MRIASYRTSKGAGYGIVIEDGIVDLTRRIGGKYPDLRALIAGGAIAQAEKIAKRAKRLINYISTFTSLEPGDVIVTGTPGGVGARRNPPLWMKAGDKVEVEVMKIGVLVNTIKAERAARTATIPQSGLEARLAGVA